MATIPPYISEGVLAGQKVALKVQGIRWRTVGHGQLKVVSDFELVIDGRVELAVYQGDLHVRIALPDQDAAAAKGPCSVHLNSFKDDEASYRTQNGGLMISFDIDGEDVRIRLSRSERKDMTECAVSGPIDLTAYVDPAAD